MRKIIIFCVVLFTAGMTFGQLKIGYVDSDTIMEQLPDAQDAQQKINNFIQEWNEELKKLDNEYGKKYKEYDENKLMMSDAKRIEVEKELRELEDEIENYRQKKFGVNGELFSKQEEIMKPIQNKIFGVIQEIAEEEEFDYIFDRSGDIMFLYAKEDYDITNLVLERLQQ